MAVDLELPTIEIVRDGYSLLPQVFSASEASDLAHELDQSLLRDDAASTAVRHRDGAVYAARNVLELWPSAAAVWRRPLLVSLLTRILGRRFGLVRVLYFDKPPSQTWALPWHKDLSIAVRPHQRTVVGYSRVRPKAGVPHCEPPVAVLENMLTLRVHLDDVTDENGPLEVLPGSHVSGKSLALNPFEPRRILASAGDVLAMRPLLAHTSGRSREGTTRHRRVLHFEFAGSPELPGGHHWHDYLSAPDVLIEGSHG